MGKVKLDHDSILAMARTHSHNEIAKALGYSKHATATVIWRSGALKDNPQHDAMTGGLSNHAQSIDAMQDAIKGCYIPSAGLAGSHLLNVVSRWTGDCGLKPHNLTQVVNELEYWHALVEVGDESLIETRKAFLEWCLANWRPRGTDEALAVFDRLVALQGAGNVKPEAIKQLIKG